MGELSQSPLSSGPDSQSRNFPITDRVKPEAPQDNMDNSDIVLVRMWDSSGLPETNDASVRNCPEKLTGVKLHLWQLRDVYAMVLHASRG